MLSKGIDTTIRELIEQLPKGSTGANTSIGDFDKLVNSLAEKITSAIVSAQSQAYAPASTGIATTAVASTAVSASSPQSRLNAFQLSLLRDRDQPMLEQLSNSLTAGDPQYNQREGILRERLDIDELEGRLKDYARSYDVPYDRSDLEGVLRNAGYDAAHLGSSERYMDAVEHFMGEAKKNYQRGATNIPGQG